MKVHSSYFLALFMGAVLLLVTGCPNETTVAKIQQDPGRYYNKEVGIKGTVTESFGALGTGVYQVDDGTGKIWVFSESYGVPNKGARVGVAGTVVNSVSFAGKSYATAIRQTHRRS